MIKSLYRKFRKLVLYTSMIRYKPTLFAPMPDHIEIEVTTRCNATCGTCSRSSLHPNDLKNDLLPETLDKILTTLPDLKTIRLAGLGEIFLHPNIEFILKKLTERSIKVWIITNGSLLLNEKIRRLIHEYVYEVGISIDSTEPEEFAQIRPMGKVGLNEVLTGMRMLLEERNRGDSSVIIGIHNTTTEMNYKNLSSLGSLCIDLSVDYLAIGFVENWLVRGDPDYQPTADRIHKSLLKLPEIRKAIIKQQWRLAFRGIMVGYKIPKRRIGKCQWPYRAVHITAEGNVTPCCTRTQPSHGLFNILTDDFEKNWNGEAYQNLRRAHMNRDTLNSICGNCPL
jgi:radical SAM protein with 4Fe4S-binding SPASM domain